MGNIYRNYDSKKLNIKTLKSMRVCEVKYRSLINYVWGHDF